MSYFVSAELSSFLGVRIIDKIPRHEIESKVLDYVKEKGLIDERNAAVIHTDDTLEKLMNGKEVFAAFSIIPYLKHHLFIIDDGETSQANQIEETQEEIQEETHEDEHEHEETQEDEHEHEETQEDEHEHEETQEDEQEETQEDEQEETQEDEQEETQEDEQEETQEDEHEQEETQEDESYEEEPIRKIILRNHSGEEILFEASNRRRIRIQRKFVLSNEDFHDLVNTICPESTDDKEEHPYETIACFITFIVAFLSLSLWLSIFNSEMVKMNR
jgi:flagellar biosynthesis GTPase FlhF